MAAKLEGAERVGRMHSMLDYDGYLRESAGPGWALVGDAGHFKDPTPGQGISDAFRQAEALTEAIAGSLALGDAGLDAAVERWWRWRDADASEKYWFAYDLGRAGPVTPVVRTMLQRIIADPRRLAQFVDIFSHRVKPSSVLSPPRLLATAAGLAWRGPRRAEVLREVRGIVAEDLRRRRLATNPVFEKTPA
jgi:2-polyprenyl-6-methoxyphenol hydroxylase-like FAD-dependent oxidoreductase